MPLQRKRIHFWVAGHAGSAVIRFARHLWRFRFDEPEPISTLAWQGRGRMIVVFWHRHLMILQCAYRGWPFCVACGEHRDGEFSASVMERSGFLAVRGSRTRGAVKLLRNLVAAVQDGWSCVITPEGSRGPRYSVQPGVFLLARRTGVPVYPIGVAVDRAWELNTWDAFVVPKPGARISVHVADAMPVEEMAGRSAEELCADLKGKLMAANERAADGLRRWGVGTPPGTRGRGITWGPRRVAIGERPTDRGGTQRLAYPS